MNYLLLHKKKNICFYSLKTLVLFCFYGTFVACNKSDANVEKSSSKNIAKVNGTELNLSDIESTIPKEISKQDSIGFVKNYLNKWASNELFYQQALNYLTSEELDVEKELEAYKKDLITYKFQTKLVNEKLDTVVTPEQINDFYNDNQFIFILKNNIVKALYIKTPKSIPNFEKLKSLCYSSNNPKDLEQLQSLCVQYANNFYMNDNTWLLYDDLKKRNSSIKRST